MARNYVCAIDIGSNQVKVLIADWKRGSKKPRILGAGTASVAGIRRGCVFDIDDAAESIGKALQEAEKSAGTTIKNAFVSIGGSDISCVRSRGIAAVSRADGEISSHDIERVIVNAEHECRMPNREIIHKIPLIFRIDNDLESKDPVGMTGARLEAEILFITGLKQNIKNAVKAVEAAGVTVDNLIVSSLAASRVVLDTQQKEVGVAVVDIGGANVSTLVFEEGLPIFLETFPMGSENITKDIAIILQVSLAEAENLKLSYTSGKSIDKKLRDVIEARVNEILEVVEKHLKKSGRERLLPAGVVLIGGGSELNGIKDSAKDSLHLPVEIGVFDFFSASDDNLSSPSWAACSGLCVLAFDEEYGSKQLGVKIVRLTGGVMAKWLRAFLP